MVHGLAQDLEAAQRGLVEAGVALTLLRQIQPHRWSPDNPDAFAHLRPVDIAQQAEGSLLALRLHDWLDAFDHERCRSELQRDFRPVVSGQHLARVAWLVAERLPSVFSSMPMTFEPG